jgi:hypothetical protein
MVAGFVLGEEQWWMGKSGSKRKNGEGRSNEFTMNRAGCGALPLAAAAESQREGHLCSNDQQNEIAKPLFSLFLFSFLLPFLFSSSFSPLFCLCFFLAPVSFISYLPQLCLKVKVLVVV